MSCNLILLLNYLKFDIIYKQNFLQENHYNGSTNFHWKVMKCLVLIVPSKCKNGKKKINLKNSFGYANVIQIVNFIHLNVLILNYIYKIILNLLMISVIFIQYIIILIFKLMKILISYH